MGYAAVYAEKSRVELKQFYALLMPNPPSVPGFVARDILRSVKSNAWIINRAMSSMLTGRDVTDKLLPESEDAGADCVGCRRPHHAAESRVRRCTNLIPQSEMDVIPGCGHLAPSQCAAKIGPGVASS